MAPHSSILALRIPGMREPGGLPSMGSHRVGYDWSDLAAAAAAGGKKSTSVGSLNPQEEMKTRNGKNVGNYKRLNEYTLSFFFYYFFKWNKII